MLEITQEEIFQINHIKYKDKYEELETIAKGAFGTVIKVKERSTQKIYAVKILSKEKYKSSAILQLKREVLALKEANHPNIVKFFDFYETEMKIYIIMEYIKCGTLTEYIKKEKEKITEITVKKIAFHLLETVEYLHKLDFCHRDLKPDNIMFSESEKIESLKIIDFGLSTKLDNRNEKDYCGTIKFMAPEILLNQNYSREVDMWSVGIIIYMLLNKGAHPFYEKNDDKENYIKKVINKNFPIDQRISRHGRNLLKHLIEVDPIKRYSATVALKNKWFLDLISPKIAEKDKQLEKREIQHKLIGVYLACIFISNFNKEEKSLKLKQLDAQGEESCGNSTTDRDHASYSKDNEEENDTIRRKQLLAKHILFCKNYKMNIRLSTNFNEIKTKKPLKSTRPKSKDLSLLTLVKSNKSIMSPKKDNNKLFIYSRVKTRGNSKNNFCVQELTNREKIPKKKEVQVFTLRKKSEKRTQLYSPANHKKLQSLDLNSGIHLFLTSKKESEKNSKETPKIILPKIK